MPTALVEGPPDDFWSKSEEQAAIAEIEEPAKVPPKVGRKALYYAVFDPRQPISSPYVLGDPYDKLWFLSPN